MKMIEVEEKIKIGGPREFRSLARALGKFVGRERKVDDYYTLEPKGKYPRKSLRVRKRENVYEVNFKQKLSYLKGVYAKREQEFSVSDLKNFLALIKDFGFRKWLRKEKVSEVYEINKNFHIEINYVKGLGWFLEIEYLCEEKDIKKARAEILGVVKKLGVDKRKIIKEGYTKMLWDKNRC